MPLLHLVVLAVLQGAAEALPISASGHAAAARLWLAPGAAGPGLEAVLDLATALALGIASAVSLATASLVAPRPRRRRCSRWPPSPAWRTGSRSSSAPRASAPR